jgi:hypothetical protein
MIVANLGRSWLCERSQRDDCLHEFIMRGLGRENEEHSKLSYRQLSNRSFVDFGLLRKRLVVIRGMSGVACRCQHWLLDAL